MAVSFPNQYPVNLSPAQRQSLSDITRVGNAPASKIRHAQILLWSDVNRDEGRLSSREIAERLEVHVNTVDRTRKRFVLDGEEPALNRKVRETPPTPPIFDGHLEGQLVAICCGPAPEGRSEWTMELLATEMKRRGLVTRVSAETVRRTLKKTSCNRGVSNAGVFRNGTAPDSSRRWKKSSISIQPSTPKKSR